METKEFTARNIKRCESETGFNHKIEDWSLSDWMVALTGEVGEAANIVKKINRYRDGISGNDKGIEELMENLEDELADVYIYLDHIVNYLGCDLGEIVQRKFDKTSEKIGYKE